MKAVLRFDLDEPSDQKKFKAATTATDMALALWTLGEDLRRALDKDEPPTLQDFNHTFYSVLDRYSINLSDLID